MSKLMCINEEDGRMDEMINGQKDGWMDGQTNNCIKLRQNHFFSRFCFPQLGCSPPPPRSLRLNSLQPANLCGSGLPREDENKSK